MRNLKKILALVLALVMVVGMMSIASAATAGTKYADDSAIVSYDEAVQVLTGLGIYKGQGGGNFAPNATITRAEVAALVYRIATGDTSDVYKNLYSDYGKFADVASTAWYAGYVNYCANGKYIMGDGTNFYPDLNVNGYQILAIMLRLMGYGKNGEFEGTGWEIRTATTAKELGITDTIMAGTLGAAATRGMVAEILFRCIAKTSTVNYTALWGYRATGKTLGNITFGLDGKWSVNVAADATAFDKMITRNAAAADTKYGEPVAYWYATSVVSTLNPTGAIAVRFNPVATYTVGITNAQLYAATGDLTVDKAVDGVDTDLTYAVTTATDKATAVADTAKGAVTELFKADGQGFMVIKNTYVDKVKTAYSLVGDTETAMALTNNTVTIDVADDNLAALAGIAAKTVVIFNVYDSYADYTTIKAAPSANVVVTNTYDTDNNATSYFLAGKKYEYNCKFAGNYLTDEILNRDDQWVATHESAFVAKQTVYTDDLGYVVYAEPTAAAAAQNGWLVLTSATFNNYQADNGYYLVFKGYDKDGKAVSVKGAINAEAYGTRSLAENGIDAFDAGVYYYTYNPGTDLYTMVKSASSTLLNGSSALAKVQAGDASITSSGKLGLDAYSLVDDATVYVIANYNAYGYITGYSVKTGFKTIGDLVPAKTAAWTAPDQTAPAIEWVNLDMTAEALAVGYPNTIDLVYIEGYVSTADTVGTPVGDTGFIILDTTPEDFVSTYDTHKVVKNGQVTTMTFCPNVVNNYGSLYLESNYYYQVATTKNGHVASVRDTVVGPTGIRLAAPGVLETGTYTASTGAFSAAGTVTMADNCQVYLVDTSASTSTLVPASAYATTLLGAGAGFVAAYDAYGFASVVYVVVP